MNNTGIISIIVPLYNEASNIDKLIKRIHASVVEITSSFEIILINDGSSDSTLQKIKESAGQNSCVKYISLSRNFGHQIAVSAGIDFCRGKVVVIMDGDLQDPPELIPKIYEKYEEGFDVVYARRIRRNGESIFKKSTAKIFYRILERFTHFKIPLDAGDFRLIDRKVVKMLKQMPEQNKFLRGQIAWMGFRQTYVEFERAPRLHGKTGYSFRKMLDFALDGITSLSNRPLRVVTQAGFIVSFLSFIILLYALGSHFILERTITGWTSLIISVALLGGVQLLSIGIIGEYISRINKNVLDRPLYVIEESNC